MEKALNVHVIEADFLWDDMGHGSLTRVVDADEQGNVARGDFIPIDSTGCVVHSDGGLIAAIGVNDLVIVKNDDVVVICPKARDQEIKTLVQMLQSDPERQRYERRGGPRVRRGPRRLLLGGPRDTARGSQNA